MRILNFGSLNIDTVYRMPHVVRGGETLTSLGVTVFAGGKGANQSVALARAGAHVFHAGRIGHDGRWLLEKLSSCGVDTSLVAVDSRPDVRTGSAIIQVDHRGENAIILDPGANHLLTPTQIDDAIARFGPDDLLLLQNETNEIPYLIAAGKRQGMAVAFNPAPMGPAVRDHPLRDLDLLIVNETEGRDLTAKAAEQDILRALPAHENILTLGQRGVRYLGDGRHSLPCVPVTAVDTTAAGDTFIGYYLAARAEHQPPLHALRLACHAAALCVTRPGALDAIPTRAELADEGREGTGR